MFKNIFLLARKLVQGVFDFDFLIDFVRIAQGTLMTGFKRKLRG